MRGEEGLRTDLAALAIPFAEHEHEAVFTVEQSRHVDAGIPGAHTKNLFLKDAKGVFWLVTVPAEARVDLKALPGAIGCKRVSFGKADDMERLIGIAPGPVTPQRDLRDRGRAGRRTPRKCPPASQHRDAGAVRR